MTTLDASAREALSMLEAKSLKRSLTQTERHEGVSVTRAGKRLISFSCNDYLGLTHHPEVLLAAHAAIDAHGAGAGASRLVTGNYPLYDELESLLASLKGTEAACAFGSGYLANLGAIPVLVGSGDLILADRLSHACMLDGARLSGANLMRFTHNSAEHLAVLLAENRRDYQRCLILTETVFSMDGDLAPIEAYAALARAHDAWLMTDDAHGLGVLPREESVADLQMGTLSKAAGSYGGYVCGAKDVIDLLKTSARSVMFSTALPPAAVAASIAALNIIQRDSALAAKPLSNARMFTSLLGREEAESAIVPLVLEEADRALAASKTLEEAGYLVHPIRPPTVLPGTARLRFAFSALHTPEQIEGVADVLKQHGYA